MINNIGNINQENIAGLNSAKSEQTQALDGIKKNPYATFNRDYLIDESQISKDAIKLYETEKDVKAFTKLALDGIEDDSTTYDLMQKLFSKGVIDIENDDIWSDLSGNKRLLEDILG